MLLIGTKTLVLNLAMSGLATGCVIPKLKVTDLVTPVAHDGPGGVALGVPLLDDDDNRRQTRKHFALIYGARCIYCKNFHNPKSKLVLFQTKNNQSASVVAHDGRDRATSSGCPRIRYHCFPPLGDGPWLAFLLWEIFFS